MTHRPPDPAIVRGEPLSEETPPFSDETGTRSRTDPKRKNDPYAQPLGGRPWRDAAEERRQRFAELLAAGKTPRQAGIEARIDPWRAFKLATDKRFAPEFWKLVHDYQEKR